MTDDPSPAAMTDDGALRRHLLDLLDGRGAHVDFDGAVTDLPAELRGVRPEGSAYSAWELVEHLRIALWDLVEFSRNADHESPEWPDGYWPADPAPPDRAAWDASVAAYRRHLDEMKALVAESGRDLTEVLPWSESATLLREALLAADHAAYHVGQIVLVRRLLGAWPPADS